MGDGDVFADLSDAERRFLRVRLNRLTNLGAMVLGAYGEAVVAHALPGAEETPGGTDRYDLLWRDVKIEVKCTRGAMWAVAPSNLRVDGVKVRARRADIYILARHEGSDHRTGWSFYVVPRSRLDEYNKASVTRKRIDEWGYRPVEVDGIEAAVEFVARSLPGTNRPA